MIVRNPYNATLLNIVARKGKVTYTELKEEYCTPSPPGVVLGRNVMLDTDLETLETEGYIHRVDDQIIYIHR